jgi:c(7)-type cytochrome triheme protein
LSCHGDKAQHNPGPACVECHDFRIAGAGKAGAASGPPAITFPADSNSPGKVTFEHTKHLARGAKCADCHPKLFAMKKGGAKLAMESMGDGATCGACHNGKKAFGVTDGDKCLDCHKES